MSITNRIKCCNGSFLELIFDIKRGNREAINCIIKRPDEKLFGCNTDYIGAISAIEEGLQGSQPSIYGSPLAGKLFVVIGASGAGKAIAYVAKENTRVVIAKRTYVSTSFRNSV
ncbi:hypothetical protein RDI58_017792 [Solanum bulbocastanum]|uniref:Uncharacterized protein n=1 Tax=Solanum bulbocastanum TaxID=147425 RepID=A0AAN8TFP5_SOLBU